MQEPLWLERRLIEAMHMDQIRQHGGQYGARDEKLILSALARPKQRYRYDRKADLAALAASYGVGLTKNHGFIDGNKRVGFMAMYTFLGLNGWEINAPEPEIIDVMLQAAEGKLTETGLAEWLCKRIIPWSEK